MRKVLVLRGGALGDFIVTLPALAALRRALPSARLELAGNATAAQLALTRGFLDAAHSQHDSRWSALYGTAPLPPDFAAWLSTFDLILSFWPDPDHELAARFPLHPAQTFLTAPAHPTIAPAAAHYCAPLRILGIEAQDYHVRLDASSSRRGSSTARDNAPDVTTTIPIAPIVIHPGSGSPRKNWPAENWRTLIAQLPAPITLILGEAELKRWGPLSAAGLGSNVHTALHSPPLETLVTHLSLARLFLGHDSGISHLAAACGAPSLLLFGPTDPATWAPPAPHVQVLHRPNLATLSVAEVLSAIAIVR